MWDAFQSSRCGANHLTTIVGPLTSIRRSFFNIRELYLDYSSSVALAGSCHNLFLIRLSFIVGALEKICCWLSGRSTVERVSLYIS